MFTVPSVHRHKSCLATFLIGAAVLAGPAAFAQRPQAAAGGAPATTITFRPGDGSAFSSNYDWRLIQKYPKLTSTLWTDDVVAGRDPWSSTEQRVLLNIPDFIGSAPGQVPPGAQVIQARVRWLAQVARNVPIEVREVVERNVGRAGQHLGVAIDAAPSWNDRAHGTAWSAPGAGWPASSAAIPLDVRTVTQNFAWVEFDVTSAVQHWVTDPTTNQGLLFSSPDLTKPGQGFQGGNAPLAERPFLIVTFSSPAPSSGPALAITSSTASPVENAYVEGTVGADATELAVRIDGGPEQPMGVDSVGRWHLNVPATPAGTAIDVVARNTSGLESHATAMVTFVPTDFATTAATTIGRGEAPCFSRSMVPFGTALVRFEDGQGWSAGRCTVPAGQASTAMIYPTPGTYTAKATCLDAFGNALATSTMTVRVVELASVVGTIATQAGFLRDVAFTVAPSIASATELAVTSSNPDRLHVKGTTVAGSIVVVAAAPLGAATDSTDLQIRVGGPSGRVIQRIPVHPFLISHDELLTSTGPSSLEFRVRVVPTTILATAPNLRFRVRVFSDGSAFPAALDPDGDREILVDGSAFDVNGTLELPALQNWALTSEFCRKVQPMQLETGPGLPSGAIAVMQGSVPSGAATGKNGKLKNCGLAFTLSGRTDPVINCSYTYSVSVESGMAPYTCKWFGSASNGSTVSGGLSKDFVAIVEGGGWVAVTVTDASGCSATAQLPVNVLPDPQVVVTGVTTIPGAATQISPWLSVTSPTQVISLSVTNEVEVTESITGVTGVDATLVKNELQVTLSVAVSAGIGMTVSDGPGLTPGAAYAYFVRPILKVTTGVLLDHNCTGAPTSKSWTVTEHDSWNYWVQASGGSAPPWPPVPPNP